MTSIGVAILALALTTLQIFGVIGGN